MYIYVFITILIAFPAARLVWLAITDGLGANPVEFITHSLGTWTLIFLLMTLSITPLRKILTWNALAKHRRTFGLCAFTYACLHMLSYIGLDFWFDWAALQDDIIKHPYLLIGVAGWCLMLPLAVTSTKRMMQRLGRRWGTLHRTIYAIAILGIVHFLMVVKLDPREPAVYALVLFTLLMMRTPWFVIRRPERSERTTAESHMGGA